MKNLKKIFSLLLVVVMLFSTAIIVSADEPVPPEKSDIPTGYITINDYGVEGIYNGYMLINSTNSADDTSRYTYTVNEKYIDILYSVTASVTIEEAKEVELDVKHEQVLVYLERFEHDGDDMRAFTDKVYRIIQKSDILPDKTFNGGERTEAFQGYWLLADVTDLNQAQDSSNSLVMVDTIGAEDLEVKVKKSLPTVFKKVLETNDSPSSTSGTITGSKWQDAADYDIGDSIRFRDTGTVADTIGSYEQYYYAFHNTITNHTYVDGSAVVKINGKDYTSEFTVEWNAETKQLDVFIDDILSLKNKNGKSIVNADSLVVLTYNATLDDTAVTGVGGNPSVVVLEYSNNPYDLTSTGFTAEDRVVVFTYKIVVNKIIGTLETPDTPDTPDTPTTATKKTATAVPGEPLNGAGFTLYKLYENEGYVQVGDELKGGSSFTFNGIDAGVYKLVESTVPDGFNKAEDLVFVVVAVYDIESANPQLRGLAVRDTNNRNITATENNKEAIFSVELSSGTLTTYVKNYSGTEMPSTGGVGTVLIYILGAVIFAGALILLIIKLRTKAQSETE